MPSQGEGWTTPQPGAGSPHDLLNTPPLNHITLTGTLKGVQPQKHLLPIHRCVSEAGPGLPFSPLGILHPGTTQAALCQPGAASSCHPAPLHLMLPPAVAVLQECCPHQPHLLLLGVWAGQLTIRSSSPAEVISRPPGECGCLNSFLPIHPTRGSRQLLLYCLGERLPNLCPGEACPQQRGLAEHLFECVLCVAAPG